MAIACASPQPPRHYVRALGSSPCASATRFPGPGSCRPSHAACMLAPMDSRWPALALEEWEPTYLTLHRWTQIVGKIRLALAPPLNHWWHTPLYVSARGLTATMPCDSRLLTLAFDFCSHRLVADTSDKRSASLALEPMAVAEFYRRVLDMLAGLGVHPRIHPVPVEVVDKTP